MAETTNKSSPRAFRSKGKQTLTSGGFPSLVLKPPVVTDFDEIRRWTDTFTGTKNPQHRSQIKAVTSATTAATGQRIVVRSRRIDVSCSGLSVATVPIGDQEIWYRRNVSYQRDTFPMSASYFDMPTIGITGAAASNQAIQKLHAQLISFQSSLGAGEDLGEISRTLQMIRSPLKDLRKLTLTGLTDWNRALTMRDPQKMVRALASTHLEYAFGIKPLVSSISKAMVGMKGRDYLGHYYPFNATGTSESMVSNSSTEIGAGALIIPYSVVRKNKDFVRYNGVWGVRVNVNTRSVDEVLRLRTQDIIPTFWNLIPYSWAVDYVTNIGNILDSFSVPWGGVRWCCRTQRVEGSTILAQGAPRTNLARLDKLTVGSPGSLDVRCTQFGRANIVDMPIPSLEFRPLANGSQMLNLAAAILQKIPLTRILLGKAKDRFPSVVPETRALLIRGSMDKVRYPFHR